MGDGLKPWQIAYRLGRAGVRLDHKEHGATTIKARYRRPGDPRAPHYGEPVIAATITAHHRDIGRRRP